MRNVSIRTLTLMFVLLLAVASHQYLTTLRDKANAIWVADDYASIQMLQRAATCPANS